MYFLKITNSIKQRGKRQENEYKFVGELNNEIRKQWQRIFSHAEAGIRYQLFTYEEYKREKAKEENKEE